MPKWLPLLENRRYLAHGCILYWLEKHLQPVYMPQPHSSCCHSSQPIDWEFVTSVKIRKNSWFYEIFKIQKKNRKNSIRFITSLVTAKSSNLHSTSYSYWEQFLYSRLGTIGQLRTPIPTLGKTEKLQAIRRLCNSAAINVIIWISWF